jgi:hypothetical protein
MRYFSRADVTACGLILGVTLAGLAAGPAQAQFRMPADADGVPGLGVGPSHGQDNCPGYNRALEAAAMTQQRMAKLGEARRLRRLRQVCTSQTPEHYRAAR